MKHKFFPILIAIILLSFSYHSTQAQFGTPIIDGTITANEYGLHVNEGNQQTSGSQVWYMTWDNTNLYVGLDVASVFEGAVIYIDANPITPVNDGSNSNGNLTGQTYDGTNFSHLPFRADFVTYVKNGYREYRTADLAGGWSSATTGFGSYADDGGDTREIAIPWPAITGSGRPAAFEWFGYATSSGGFGYGQVPVQNPVGSFGTTAIANHFYSILNTNTGTSTYPFNKWSYAQNFDTLANTGTPTWADNGTIANWYAWQTLPNPGAPPSNYSPGTGSFNGGALYSFGSAGNTERALGSLASNTAGNFLYGYTFTNNTNWPIASFTISYVGEQWRNGGNTTQQKLDFAYQVNAAGINSGTWTDVDSLDFTGPIATITAGALDGNLPANRVALSALVTISVPVGNTITFRFQDSNDAGNDHGLAVDGFTIVANSANAPTAISLITFTARPLSSFLLILVWIGMMLVALGIRNWRKGKQIYEKQNQ